VPGTHQIAVIGRIGVNAVKHAAKGQLEVAEAE
jgi:hypothetical protein